MLLGLPHSLPIHFLFVGKLPYPWVYSQKAPKKYPKNPQMILGHIWSPKFRNIIFPNLTDFYPEKKVVIKDFPNSYKLVLKFLLEKYPNLTQGWEK